MKCLLCPAEIDETKEIPHALDEHGKPVNGVPTEEERGNAVRAQRAHSKQLNSWRQLVVLLDEGNKAAKDRHLVRGHICPGHADLKPGDLALSLVKDGGK